jgi:alanyl-tRNA synthetase
MGRACLRSSRMQTRGLQSLPADEVRARFLRFFDARGHRVVPSASLVPPGADGSLLFTNAGMVPFKQVFTGQERREYARAASAQRCVRAGGKHNDLEQVGLTRRHHTLFEMLGNFSFGDYFKEQAIAYSWQFLTQDLGLPTDRLHVTVLDSDAEARALWKAVAGLPDHRIVSHDEKENFWAMGDSGPCGPCSEIFWDLGDHIADPDERFLELWNLVFMQFQRNEGDPPGALRPLPNRSVDTGMGLERVASVLQNVPSNYHTDAFVPLMRTVAAVLDSNLDSKAAGSPFQTALEHELDPAAWRFGDNAHIRTLRIVADHLRATYAMLRDGIFPSNIGRGYVLRRIIRRAIRHAQQLGVRDGLFLSEIVMPEWEQQPGFPQLRAIVANEERAFDEMLRNGRHAMEKVFTTAQSGDRRVIVGADAFRLYDTFGIPLDITQVLAEERGITIDVAGFDAAMQEHRRKASESSVFGAHSTDAGAAASRDTVSAGLGKTEFVGYDQLKVSSARVLSVRRAQSPKGKKQRGEGERAIVSIDPCPFYAEGGGQVGDRGHLFFTAPSGKVVRLAVVDTQKKSTGGDESGSDVIEVHCMLPSGEDASIYEQLEDGVLSSAGVEVTAEVDAEFRSGCQAHHTATHLLQRALKQVLGDHVTQCGSLVASDRLRFDFAHFGALSTEEMDRVEALVNEMALERHQVSTLVLPREQAEQSGAICNFGEKYGEIVRVVRVGGDAAVSSEFCGGTHASNSQEIFPFVILSEGSVAAGTRRMEAVAGVHGAKHLQTKDRTLSDLASQLETTPAKVPERVTKIQKQVKTLESQLQALGDVVATAFPPTPLVVAEMAADGKASVVELHELPELKGGEMAKVLRRRAEFLLSRQPGRVVFVSMGSQLVCVCSGDDGQHAGRLLQAVLKPAGGRGGGNATFAQGSLPAGASTASLLAPLLS